ncbi:GtrA family protein [Streptomyces sp. NBC_00690]|uniref:GtrA family protein n=1 Tax=Streptomyces sp. NBC_00690 TaxID=2975808 RepID=UPI002E2C92E0|nr:GtrA family protein [Streptomyces sp. NBC_00690]
MSERGGALRGQLQQLLREVAKFGAVGGAGVIVNLAIFNLVRATTEIPVVRASLIANAVAIITNYLGYRYFTYRDRDKSGRTRELSLFMVFSLVGMVIENGILYVATYGFGWDSSLQSNLFKFLGIGIATLFRFWSYRTWVFRTLPDREPEPVAADPAYRVVKPQGEACPDNGIDHALAPSLDEELELETLEQEARSAEPDAVGPRS